MPASMAGGAERGPHTLPIVRRVAGALALLALLVPSQPAPAHPAAAACLIQGSASVSPGRLHAQLSGATWSFYSALDICAATGISGVGSGNVTGAGWLFGDCTAWIGSGSLQSGEHDLIATGVGVGATWVFHGTGVSTHWATSMTIMQTRALPTVAGHLPCITEPASYYLLVGVVVSTAVT